MHTCGKYPIPFLVAWRRILDPPQALFPMTTSSIANATLGDLVAFHAQVETLAQAGLLPPSNCFANAEVARTVNYRVASQLALKTAQGASFTDAFCSTKETPESYRLAFLAWYSSNRTPQSLELLNGYQPRRAGAMFGRYVSLQLGIISAVAFCVLVLWVWNAVPSLVGMYLQERAPLGVGAKFLRFLHEWLAIWAIGIPSIAIVLVAWRRFAAKKIPQQREERLQTSQREALRVDFLSLLQSSGSTLEDSLAIYQKAVGSENRLEPVSEHEANLEIAKWAVHQFNELSLGWKNSWSAHCYFATIAGVVVFGVALALFQPMIELLLHLCQHGGS
jgi:type II secretory pathway component PulF